MTHATVRKDEYVLVKTVNVKIKMLHHVHVVMNDVRVVIASHVLQNKSLRILVINDCYETI
jgi:hypothetical protein